MTIEEVRKRERKKGKFRGSERGREILAYLDLPDADALAELTRQQVIPHELYCLVVSQQRTGQHATTTHSCSKQLFPWQYMDKNYYK